MLNKIIKFSLTNRLAILCLSVLLMMGGIYVANRMDVDVFPDLNAPTVVVMTEAKGMAPEEVERLVTFPIETAVNGAPDVRRVRSSSTTGFSVVWVEFDWGTDVYRARQIVTEKTAGVKETLPEVAGTPTLGPQSSILGELMFVALTSDSTSLQQLRTLADWTIRPRLMAERGVAQVSVIGGDVKEYQILLSPSRMRYHDVGLDEVMAAVRGMNQNAAGGSLYEHGNEYIIRGLLSTSCIDDLSQAVVKTSAKGEPVLLSQIADVKVGNRSPLTGWASVKNKPAVFITVTKQAGASTLQLTQTIDEALADMQKNLPPDVRLNTDIYRQERFIRSSIDNVQKSLIEGGFFVIVILFLFLMNVRTTVISLVTIPLSLAIALLVLNAMGLTINTMSLGGMAIAIGSLVDDAIVDVENVYKRLREHPAKAEKGRWNARLQVIYDASREVRMPIFNSTLIIIVSFLPLFFLSGMEGRMLVPLGIAFITALCASTFVALTLTPVLCSYLLHTDRIGDKTPRRKEPAVSRFFHSVYDRMLSRALDHPRYVLVSTGVALILALSVFFNLGRSFLPPFNEGSFTINVSTLPGVSLEQSNLIGARVEKILLQIPEVKTVGRKTGRAELDEHALGINVSELEVPYELKDRNKAELMADIRHRLQAVPGISVEVGAPISHRIDAMLSGTRAGIAIKIFGPDLNRLFQLGNQIRGALSGVDGLADVNVEQQVERPQLQIVPNRTMLARYGVTLPQFAEMVNVLFGGEAVSTVYDGEQAYDLVVKAGEAERHDTRSIEDIMVDAGGKKVPLNQIADVRSAMGPNTINRENVARKIVVSANVDGRDLLGTVNDIKTAINKNVDVPEGYHIEYGGQFESEQAASRTLLVASCFSIIVIFLLIFNQFRNVTQSLVILLNLPLALIGGVFAIWVANGELSIPAIIGFISLFGIATRNGMLLVARYNDLASAGCGVKERIMMGSVDRLNPILMTALTSALALIPLVIGSQLPGNEIQSPMAVVILGGLLTSTLLNAFVIPIIYGLTHRDEETAICSRT